MGIVLFGPAIALEGGELAVYTYVKLKKKLSSLNSICRLTFTPFKLKGHVFPYQI